ncbi:hypothetical protein AB1Y20_004637 [Prymnesium parvum]|uniref:Major facilitator superfamily (MFS) profile domain-containing protein n=1 Tax=Prymnesium parvum TaxID=97485 RepID=A0AB34IZN1_PRYPA
MTKPERPWRPRRRLPPRAPLAASLLAALCLLHPAPAGALQPCPRLAAPPLPLLAAAARPPRLCAARLPPAPPPRPPSLAERNAFRVLAATLLITLDITFYTFPLPFLADFLSHSLGCPPAKVATLVATFTYSALAAGAAIVVMEGRRRSPRRAAQQCVALAAAAALMGSVAAAQAAVPRYAVLLVARLVQGAVSQFAWATALAAAASLAPLADVKATAWVMAGNSLGELLGPQFGSKLYAWGGVRLPFAVASAMAFLLAGAFGSSAVALRDAPETDASTSQAATRPKAKSPLRDARTVQLCVGLALSCGVVRSVLDSLLPLYLHSQHGFSIHHISNVMLCAALCFIVGSTSSGFVFARWPHLVNGILVVAAFATSILTGTVFLPATGIGVSAIYCGYCMLSAFVSIAVTSALEERGKALGNTDDVMALQVFFWTLGFGVGGVLAVLASGGAGSAARQRIVMAAAGGLNALYATSLVAAASRRRKRR